MQNKRLALLGETDSGWNDLEKNMKRYMNSKQLILCTRVNSIGAILVSLKTLQVNCKSPKKKYRPLK